MGTHRLLLLRWKNEKNETRTANLYLYTSSGIGGVGGTYWSASSWVGTTFDGEVDNVDWWHPDKGVYIKNDTDGTVGIVSKFKSFETIGDTGTGRIYKGCSGTYPVPINFDWECIEVGAEAAKKRGAEQQAQEETAIGIGPFTSP
jgi:hypothetical protein